MVSLIADQTEEGRRQIMNSLNALVSLDDVVASVINLMKADERDYVHIKQLTIEGYQELCLVHLNNTKIAYLPVEDDEIVTLPEDFLYHSLIGVIYSGKVWSLALDNRIPLTRDMSCGEDSPPTPRGVSALTTTPNYMYRGYKNTYSAYFADAGGYNFGYYRIDEERREIQLRWSQKFDNIVLEYCNIPIAIGEDTMIKRYVLPALRAYVMKKVVQYDTRVADKEKARREFDYDRELYILRSLENQLTADELKDIINSTRTQGLKR